MTAPRRRSGLTLIEVLAAIGVVGLLACVLLPAVVQARSAALRARCSNNLRQLGLALQNYDATHNVFPAACGMPNYAQGELASAIVLLKQYSALSQLLPFLGEAPTFNAINFQVGLQDLYIFGDGRLVAGMSSNSTAFAARLNAFLCPSDGSGRAGPRTGASNYRVNLGAERWQTLFDSSTDGPIMGYRCRSAASVSDGLSNTGAFSEKVRGMGNGGGVEPRADMILGGLGADATADESRLACALYRDAKSIFYATGGWSWAIGTLSHTCYNHVNEPNSSIPDCVSPVNPICGILGARSNHPAGVHLGMTDGSVRFVRNGVDRAVWRALGTKAGGEVISGEGAY